MVAILSLAGPVPAARAQEQEPAPAPAPVERPLRGAMTFAAGATCLDAGRLEDQVQAWLGVERVPPDVRLDVRGDERDPRAVAFRISRPGSAHDRRFDRLPESCSDATAIVGLAIALAIDASILPELLPAPAPAKPGRIVAIEASAGFEVLPGASVGGSVGAEVRLVDWLAGRVDVEAQFSWGNAIDGTSGQFDASLAAAAPQLCSGGAVGPLRVELCSGAGFGLVHAQGHGFSTSRGSTGPWIVAQGGLRVVFVAGIPWTLDFEGVFPLHVPDFRAESSSGAALYRSISPAAALLGAGPVFSF